MVCNFHLRGAACTIVSEDLFLRYTLQVAGTLSKEQRKKLLLPSFSHQKVSTCTPIWSMHTSVNNVEQVWARVNPVGKKLMVKQFSKHVDVHICEHTHTRTRTHTHAHTHTHTHTFIHSLTHSLTLSLSPLLLHPPSLPPSHTHREQQ